MQTVQQVTQPQQAGNETDSLFGICQAAGDDLGINPFFLRIGLIGVLFFNPALMLSAYAGLGLVVGASRLLFPKPGVTARAGIPAEQPGHIHREPELIAA